MYQPNFQDCPNFQDLSLWMSRLELSNFRDYGPWRSRTCDVASVCLVLVNVLEDKQTEEMKVTAMCALWNLVMNSRSNRRAAAEAASVWVVTDLIGSSNPQTSVQAAIIIKLLILDDTI